MLKRIRISLATFFWVALTLLFLDFTGVIHCYLGWVAHMQFVPAVLAVNFLIIFALLALTFLFGRLYCSVICPLGICQDMVSWMAGLKNKNRFSFTPVSTAVNYTKYIILGVFTIALIVGIPFITTILEPYSAFGRMISNLLSPFYIWVNNLFAFFAAKINSYAFYSVDVWIKGIVTFKIAILTFVVVSIFAWKTGRGYCNLICPVGSFLGLIAKFSVFKAKFIVKNCNKCKLCEKTCKAECIDSTNGNIDHSRCVSCFNCVSKCPKGAITFYEKR